MCKLASRSRSCASSAATFAVKEESLDSQEPQQQQQLPLMDRLLQLHVRECQREVTWSSHLNPCSNLLTALCKRENPNRLVLTLRPGNEGYTLHLVR